MPCWLHLGVSGEKDENTSDNPRQLQRQSNSEEEHGRVLIRSTKIEVPAAGGVVKQSLWIGDAGLGGKKRRVGCRNSHLHLQVQVHVSGKKAGTVGAAKAIDVKKNCTTRSLANQQSKTTLDFAYQKKVSSRTSGMTAGMDVRKHTRAGRPLVGGSE